MVDEKGDWPEPKGLEEGLLPNTLPPSLAFLLPSEPKPPDDANPAKPPPDEGVAAAVGVEPLPKTLLFPEPKVLGCPNVDPVVAELEPAAAQGDLFPPRAEDCPKDEG